MKWERAEDQVISIIEIITFFMIENVIVLIVERFSEYHLRLTKLVDV